MRETDLSIVIPAYNEAGNIAPLLSEIGAAFRGRSYEVIVVDDCSDDGTASDIDRSEIPVRLLTHARRAGKSRALVTGFRAASGAWIATLDGDGQNDPADLAAIVAEHCGRKPEFIVAGVRKRRNDGVVKLVTSRVANFIRKRMLRDNCRDTGCGLKVMPGEFARSLPYFDNMHRFFPALARRAALDVVEHPISDRPRRHGMSKYGFFDRAAVAFLDLVGVYWLIRRSSNPGEVSERAPSRPAAASQEPPQEENPGPALVTAASGAEN